MIGDDRDPFYEVCDECGRHVVKAGHAPDCPNDEDADETEQEGDAA